MRLLCDTQNSLAHEQGKISSEQIMGQEHRKFQEEMRAPMLHLTSTMRVANLAVSEKNQELQRNDSIRLGTPNGERQSGNRNN